MDVVSIVSLANLVSQISLSLSLSPRRLCDVVNFLSDASSSGALSSSPFFHSPDDFGEYWTPDDCNTNSLYQTNVGDSEDAIEDDTYHVYAPPANEL